MRQQKWMILAALGIGAAVGACFRDAVVPSRAYAQSSAKYEYKVVAASVRPSGYEEDLNENATQGWRLVGTANNHLILERARQ